jgi:hypothetical protein
MPGMTMTLRISSMPRGPAFKEESHQAASILRAHSFWCALIIYAIIAPVWFVAHAAELDGVQLPDTLQMDGKSLHLNGFGLRTFSLLGIHIYVASLYLEHLSTDPRRSSSHRIPSF